MATPGNPAFFALARKRIECLADALHAAKGLLQFVGREEDQKRLAVQSQVRGLLEKFDPFLATGIPVLRPDAKTCVVRHQQAELQSLAVGGLQVQVRGRC